MRLLKYVCCTTTETHGIIGSFISIIVTLSKMFGDFFFCPEENVNSTLKKRKENAIYFYMYCHDVLCNNN